MPTNQIRIALMLAALLLALTSCTSFFAAHTDATYRVSADAKEITYSSNKNEQGLHAKWETYPNGAVRSIEISVDNATTPDNAVKAAQQTNANLIEIIRSLAEQAGKAKATIP